MSLSRSLSRRQLIFTSISLPVAAVALNACGGGGGGGGGSGGGGGGGGGVTSSSSSSSSSSSVSSASPPGYTAGAEFQYTSRNYHVNLSNIPAPAVLPNGHIVTVRETVTNAGLVNQTVEVMYQILNTSGSVIASELMVNQAGGNSASNATVAALADLTLRPGGGFVVTWVETDSSLSSRAVVARLYDSTGLAFAAQFSVSSSANSSASYPAAAALSSGRFVVCWNEYIYPTPPSTTISNKIKAQVFTLSGTKVGGEIAVNVDSVGDKLMPAITGLSNGGFVIAWEDRGASNNLSTSTVRAQVFDAAAAKVGSEFLVGATTNEQMFATVAALQGDGFVISWSEFGPGLVSWDIKAQLFTNAGVKTGTEFVVNTRTANYQIVSSAATLKTGDFVISWLDTNNNITPHDDYIRAQLFTATGVKSGGEFLISQTPLVLKNGDHVAALPGGGFIVNWSEFSGPLGDSSTLSLFKARVFS